MYKPDPMDTSKIKLSDELMQLVEKMAENVHEVWALGRIDDGWVYGDERNDEEKTTPCLVPYDKLSDEEKEYDRKTATETLKFILSMGYQIEKSEE